MRFVRAFVFGHSAFMEEIMEKYGVNELRRMFLDFYESKGTSCDEIFLTCAPTTTRACC